MFDDRTTDNCAHVVVWIYHHLTIVLEAAPIKAKTANLIAHFMLGYSLIVGRCWKRVRCNEFYLDFQLLCAWVFWSIKGRLLNINRPQIISYHSFCSSISYISSGCWDDWRVAFVLSSRERHNLALYLFVPTMTLIFLAFLAFYDACCGLITFYLTRGVEIFLPKVPSFIMSASTCTPGYLKTPLFYTYSQL